MLTEDSLLKLLQGSRILQVIQHYDGNEGVCVEARNGVKMSLNEKDLRLLFQKEKLTAKVKLLVLLFPGSSALAPVLQEYGVEHIVAFEALPHKSEFDAKTLLDLRQNYLFAFV